jgi:hypothetical protein
MTWNSTMGFISTVALFLPILCILLLRLGAYKTFPALLIYYSSVFIYNLFTEGFIRADRSVIHYWGISNNLLDIPLLLTFLIYFSSSNEFTKRIKYLIWGFILFEAIVVAIFGLNVNAITIILGPGIIIAIAFSMVFFIRQTKITIMHRKATGKALMAASLLFAYGCYGIIYLMYYIFKTKYTDDAFLIYFLVATLSSLLITAGIIVERKRIRKLSELKITRRELSNVYAHEKKPIAAIRPLMLDYDRDQWN